jgi:serine/threonine protein kinase
MKVPGDAAGGSLAAVAGFEVGSRVAGYRLEEQVGAGGMAVVFRARDERLGRLVALKILAPALAADEAFRQRFIGESRAAAAVDDPHIVPVFEAGEASGVLFIAMRYVPGGDVRALMRRAGVLPPGRAVWILSQVASALDAAHAAGLVHRDVKPANMLVDARAGRPDHVYLSDFGLSKGTLSTSVGLTGAGRFLGTANYISPEQIEGKPVDGRADEYALACAAFEMLTGVPPFRRDEPMAVMYAQLSEPPPPLTSRRPDLSPAADQVFARALAKAPADRYATCREFADALHAAFGLAPYDSGPGIIPAPGHPGIQAAAAAAADAADMPTGPVTGPLRPGPGASNEAQPARHGRRRTALATLSGISVLALAGISAAVISVSTPNHGPASFSTRTKTHPVTAIPTAQHRVGAAAATRHPAARHPAARHRAASAAFPVTAESVPSPTPAVPSALVHSVAAKPVHSATPTPVHSVTPTPTPVDSATPTPSPPEYSSAPGI